MTNRRTRVLIIDATASVRQVLVQVLQRDPAIDVPFWPVAKSVGRSAPGIIDRCGQEAMALQPG